MRTFDVTFIGAAATLKDPIFEKQFHKTIAIPTTLCHSLEDRNKAVAHKAQHLFLDEIEQMVKSHPVGKVPTYVGARMDDSIEQRLVLNQWQPQVVITNIKEVQ